MNHSSKSYLITFFISLLLQVSVHSRVTLAEQYRNMGIDYNQLTTQERQLITNHLRRNNNNPEGLGRVLETINYNRAQDGKALYEHPSYMVREVNGSITFRNPALDARRAEYRSADIARKEVDVMTLEERVVGGNLSEVARRQTERRQAEFEANRRAAEEAERGQTNPANTLNGQRNAVVTDMRESIKKNDERITELDEILRSETNPDLQTMYNEERARLRRENEHNRLEITRVIAEQERLAGGDLSEVARRATEARTAEFERNANPELVAGGDLSETARRVTAERQTEFDANAELAAGGDLSETARRVTAERQTEFDANAELVAGGDLSETARRVTTGREEEFARNRAAAAAARLNDARNGVVSNKRDSIAENEARIREIDAALRSEQDADDKIALEEERNRLVRQNELDRIEIARVVAEQERLVGAGLDRPAPRVRTAADVLNDTRNEVISLKRERIEENRARIAEIDRLLQNPPNDDAKKALEEERARLLRANELETVEIATITAEQERLVGQGLPQSDPERLSRRCATLKVCRASWCGEEAFNRCMAGETLEAIQQGLAETTQEPSLESTCATIRMCRASWCGEESYNRCMNGESIDDIKESLSTRDATLADIKIDVERSLQGADFSQQDCSSGECQPLTIDIPVGSKIRIRGDGSFSDQMYDLDVFDRDGNYVGRFQSTKRYVDRAINWNAAQAAIETMGRVNATVDPVLGECLTVAYSDKLLSNDEVGERVVIRPEIDTSGEYIEGCDVLKNVPLTEEHKDQLMVCSNSIQSVAVQGLNRRSANFRTDIYKNLLSKLNPREQTFAARLFTVHGEAANLSTYDHMMVMKVLENRTRLAFHRASYDDPNRANYNELDVALSPWAFSMYNANDNGWRRVFDPGHADRMNDRSRGRIIDSIIRYEAGGASIHNSVTDDVYLYHNNHVSPDWSAEQISFGNEPQRMSIGGGETEWRNGSSYHKFYRSPGARGVGIGNYKTFRREAGQ